ncbi:RTA1 like protein [Purpureocillium lavendulum]|uniref:RTA1 like protein n=1 Tax=Purpureocillium lavendulum TaxID=1247861 RepID=A0AB34FQQ9_9HYPO|nr:RTA1 like protein [Purpureocillium lavendulum]
MALFHSAWGTMAALARTPNSDHSLNKGGDWAHLDAVAGFLDVMMLTIKQPSAPYGYKSVHDLPTPPATSRPSPPLSHQEAAYKPNTTVSRSHSPVNQLMSAPHRGLPPPAAMALPPQQPPPAANVPPPPQHQTLPHGSLVHGPPQGPAWTSLPYPPPQWDGAEDSMKNWLMARAEEEKTKQETEKTRQESLRLEQRRVEMDMLRASLGGGIPPPMIPLVFAGMGAGGTLPQTALEWAQQFMQPSQGQYPQLPPPPRQHSPEHHQREGPPSAPGQYQAAPSVPPAQAPAPGAYSQFPGSPTRPRGQTVSGVVGRPPGGLSSVAGNPPQPGQSSTAPIPPYQAQGQATQQDTSPSIYFHHWQPPTSQAGSSSSNRPGTPSGSSKTKRKRDSL